VIFAVTDTHALIWMASDERRVGGRARQLFASASAGEAQLFVPTLALVEIGEAVHRGRFSPAAGFDEWVRELLSAPGFRAVDLTLAIVRRANGLYAIPERGDRLLVATALELGCPLISRDRTIAASGLVAIIW
jgi:PIN domain nuclease of toxin-antitoxin system